MTTFELKPEHLDLLRRSIISWDNAEFGAPAIDPKRPYGNSDVINDISLITKTSKSKNWDPSYARWRPAAIENFKKIHKETQIALQIILSCQTFKVGTYKKDINNGWILAE